jgi:hypothetical protein
MVANNPEQREEQEREDWFLSEASYTELQSLITTMGIAIAGMDNDRQQELLRLIGASEVPVGSVAVKITGDKNAIKSFHDWIGSRGIL